MRVLIDTHIVLSLLRQSVAKDYPSISAYLTDAATMGFVSVATLWETVIKTRLGKLNPGMPLEDIAGYLAVLGLAILPIEARHVSADVEPAPDTRDPFDRLLLAQCQVENLFLATADRSLVRHPLALRA